MQIGPFTLFERKSIGHVDLDEIVSSGTTAAGVRVTVKSCLRVPAVAAAIRTISEACATLGITMIEIGGEREEVVVLDHPVVKRLRGRDTPVNDWSSRFELIRSLVADARIHDCGGPALVGRDGSLACQTASNIDPQSASNIDPHFAPLWSGSTGVAGQGCAAG